MRTPWLAICGLCALLAVAELLHSELPTMLLYMQEAAYLYTGDARHGTALLAVIALNVALPPLFFLSLYHQVPWSIALVRFAVWLAHMQLHMLMAMDLLSTNCF